jgi:ElaB/YqjD/DUF883 family membrane-anchored ribosome-binding protein
MVRVVVSLLAGGLIVWLWGDQLRQYSSTKSREVRAAAADTLQAVADRAGDMLDRTKDRAGDVLDRTKEQVSSALHAGQDAIRPQV